MLDLILKIFLMGGTRSTVVAYLRTVVQIGNTVQVQYYAVLLLLPVVPATVHTTRVP